jgi:hypothetical protein
MIEVTASTIAERKGSSRADRCAQFYCEQLERGEILYLSDSRFLLDGVDSTVLTHLPAESLAHKNISYSPATRRIGGLSGTPHKLVLAALQQYSDRAIRFCAELLAPYAGAWQIELCSFRPLEESGRTLSLTERNDLLHIDAFPSRPTNGARILRLFTNIHPACSRIWNTGDPLATLAGDPQFAPMMRTAIRKAVSSPQQALAGALHVVSHLGIRVPNRSPYDRAMLRLHDQMKRNQGFQGRCNRYRREFKPWASWLLFSDGLPHAVLEGQFALEQSFFIPRSALTVPQAAPVAIMEMAAHCAMTDSRN